SWANVPANGTSQNYTPGTELADGILYRRKVTSGANVGYTNTVMVYTPPEGSEPPSSQGKDFWFSAHRISTFNIATSGAAATDIDKIRIQFKFVSAESGTVTLAFTMLGTTRTVALTAGVVAQYTLTDAEKDAIVRWHANLTAINTGSNNKTVHITSTVNMSAYVINYAKGSIAKADATMLVPTQWLGKDYYHMGYRPASGQQDSWSAIATQNSTSIYENGTLLGTINAGYVWAKTGAPNVELVGTHVTADKPIAFFSATNDVGIPYPWAAYDNLLEQMHSTEKWGEHFFVPRSEQSHTRVRIMAKESGTNLTIPGIVINTAPTKAQLKANTGILGPIYTEPVGDGNTNPAGPTGGRNSLTGLSAGQFVEIDMGSASAGMFITANHPVMVIKYMVSSGSNQATSYLDPAGTWGFGDPAMSWVPATEQRGRNVMVARFYATPTMSGTTSPQQDILIHYAQIVVPYSTKGSTTVKIGTGAATPITGTWYDSGTSADDFSVLQYPLTTDNAYTFDNPLGCVINVYGSGNPGEVISYDYLGGSALKNFGEISMKVNSIAYDLMQGRVYYIHNNAADLTVTFTAEYAGTPTSITWTLDGVVQSAAANQSLWQAALTRGDHTVKMVAVFGTETFTQGTYFKIRDFVP
ncbi:MAG: IgGFc-binding protein, partial [Bacteroidales bacterium]|nr:IgGFc-binding protein [Bacteroidales bacterium]